MKFIKPSYKRMYATMKKCVQTLFMSAVFTVFTVYIMQVFLFSFAMVPLLGNYLSFTEDLINSEGALTTELYNSILSVTPTLQSVVLTVVLLIAAFAIINVLNFGVTYYLTNVSLTGNAKFSNVFKGFSIKNANVWKASFFLVLINFVFTVLYFFITRLVISNILSGVQLNSFNSLMLIGTVVTGIYLILLYLLNLTFAFLYNGIIYNPGIKFGNLLKMNFMISNPFYMLIFILYSCLKNIIMIVIFASLYAVIPEKIMSSSFILTFIFNFILFIQQYTVLLKGQLSVPIYFYSFLSENGLVKNQNKKETEVETEDSADSGESGTLE